MNDPLDWLWPLVDAPEPTVPQHVVGNWPPGVHGRLLELRLLVQIEDAARVLCPECREHFEEVVASDGPGATPRLFVPCPVVLRAHVSPEARRQWSVNFAVLAETLAVALALSGRRTEISPRRVWRLGRTKWQGTSRDVVFARGLHWDDAPMLRDALIRSRKPLVFVPRRKPPDDLWRGHLPPILALSQVATLGDTGIEVDSMEIAAAIQDADAQAAAPGEMVLSVEQLKLMIRQQVKAESKSALTDDIYVAAYRQQGSVREAATFLSEQTGQDVSKDQVHRALKRSGGAHAVLNNQDSESIQRAVASQRRDRQRRFASPSQPPDSE